MKRLGLRRLAQLGIVGLPWLGTACSQPQVMQPRVPNAMQSLPASAVDPAMSLTGYRVSAGESAFRASGAPVAEAGPAQPMTIGLDTVMRLAEEQNPQVGVARAKVEAAFNEKCQALSRWIPDISIGVGYYRHEGGIQLQEGPLVRSTTGAFLFGPQIEAQYNPREYAFRQVEAARKIWQQQGDLSKITHEQLLDASTTYVDLLAAHSALAISQELEKRLKGPYDKAVRQWLNSEKTADVEIEKTRIEAEVKLQQLTQIRLRGQIEAASAKLAYLLGVDPSTPIVPAESQMASFHIVDISQPLDQLVAQALANGPGVRELEGILCSIQAGVDIAQGPGRWVPVVKFQMGEGLFGAGVAERLDWANRWDMGVQAKWNVTDLLQAKRKREVVMSQMNQVNLTYADLKAKLTLGVQESRSAILANSAQFKSAEGLIKDARTVLDKTQLMHDDSMPGVTLFSIVTAAKAVSLAQLNYVDLMREFDKAQLRLMVVLGPGAKPAPSPEK